MVLLMTEFFQCIEISKVKIHLNFSDFFQTLPSFAASSDFATNKPYSGHRRGHRYHHPLYIRVAAGVYREATKFIPFALASSLKTRPTSRPLTHSTTLFVRSEPPERSPKIRAQTAEIPKDPSSTLRRCRRLGVADRGVASGTPPPVAGCGGDAGDRVGGSKLRVCRAVQPPSSSAGGGWLAPAPRTDQYLKHREVSSRYFRCPSAAGNEGVKNILQIARAGIISSLRYRCPQ